MGLFDSFTSLFEDSPPPPEQTTQEPPPPLYRPQDMLSTHYSLGNLIATNQALSQPNYPSTPEHMDNLTYTADILERLDQEIGPFQLLSGYRTKELQNKLSAAGEPTASASGTSFHEIGRAVDITPTTMSLTDYFGRILANEDLKNQFAEIAIKASQNALHLAVNVPSDSRTPKVLGLNTAGVYARLNLDEIANYVAPFMQSLDDAYDYAAAELVTYNKTPLILGVVAAAGGVLYLALAKGQRTRTNPQPKKKHSYGKVLRQITYYLVNNQNYAPEQAATKAREIIKSRGLDKAAGIFSRGKRHNKINPRIRKQKQFLWSAKHLSKKALKKYRKTLSSRLSKIYKRHDDKYFRTRMHDQKKLATVERELQKRRAAKLSKAR